VLIDTPAGSRNKYKFDATLGVYRVSRMLPAGAIFPYDFGSIPRTCAEDGDALDVLVLGLAPTFPGCLVTARLLGLLRAQQVEHGRSIRNDRLIAVAETEVNSSPLRELSALQPQELRAIEHFFESYNRFQGRKFRISGRGGCQSAQAALRRAERRFQSARHGQDA
jgi:inorganic pyrophosphatase